MAKRNILTKFLLWRIRHISNKNFTLILSVLVGTLAGLMALSLKASVWHLSIFLRSGLNFHFIQNYENFLLLIFPAIGIGIVVLMKKFIIRDNIKHNISSILHAISKRNSFMKAHKVFSSFFGGIVTASFGGSIGLESPIISSGGAIGSNLARILHLNYKQVTLLLACGSAGAIAAIFNTPIAAIVFVFEVLLIDLTQFTLIPLLLASVSGGIINKFLFKDEILIDFTSTATLDVKHIPFFIILAVIAGLMSYYFTRSFLYIEKSFDNIKSAWKKVLFGGVLLGILIFLLPPLYGEGYDTIKAILNSNYDVILSRNNFFFKINPTLILILFFTALLFTKVFATAITFSAGGIGGIFAPSLFTGGILGFLFAKIINSLDLGIYLPESEFALVGMACLLGGILHAPLTGMFLIVEITFGYELILPLMLASTLSYLTVKFLEPNSIFTMQLAKKGELITHDKDKAVLLFLQLDKLIEKNFSIISPENSLGDLSKTIAKSNRNLFPVVDEKQRLQGIVTLDHVREIMFNQDQHDKITVQNLMVTPPAFIHYEDTMEEVIKKFNQTGAWNLPVIDDGIYIGFVSKSKLFNAYRQKLLDISGD